MGSDGFPWVVQIPVALPVHPAPVVAIVWRWHTRQMATSPIGSVPGTAPQMAALFFAGKDDETPQ